jgi:hypothetical protein
VRAKNALNTLMMSFAALGVVGVAWALLGYSLAFAPGNAFVGGLRYAFLQNVGLEGGAWGGTPHLLFMAYQGTFAIITAALISGAVVERMRFGPLPGVHRAVGRDGWAAWARSTSREGRWSTSTPGSRRWWRRWWWGRARTTGARR